MLIDENVKFSYSDDRKTKIRSILLPYQVQTKKTPRNRAAWTAVKSDKKSFEFIIINQTPGTKWNTRTPQNRGLPANGDTTSSASRYSFFYSEKSQAHQVSHRIKVEHLQGLQTRRDQRGHCQGHRPKIQGGRHRLR